MKYINHFVALALLATVTSCSSSSEKKESNEVEAL